jgi:hypothetical protein
MAISQDEDPVVVARLLRGPKGKLRLTFEIPGTPPLNEYGPAVIELDRSRLQAVKLTQQELTEMGFRLAMQLSLLSRISLAALDA